MLRITIVNADRSATFKMEGKLCSEWVTEADRAWAEFAKVSREGQAIVDLCGVSFVDHAGQELLVRMHAAGAKLIGTGPMSSALIEEVCADRPKLGHWIKSVVSLFFLIPFLLLNVRGISSVCAQEPGTSAPLTLREAIDIAQANNRQMKNIFLTVAVDDDQVAEARTYRLPSFNVYALGSQLLTPVDFTFRKGTFGDFAGIGPIPGTDTKVHTPLRPTFYGLVQFSQPLSQQYKIGLNIRLA